MATYNNIAVVNVEDTNVVLVSCNYVGGTYIYPDLTTIIKGIKDGKMIICALYNNNYYVNTLIMNDYGFNNSDELINVSFNTNPNYWFYDGNAVYLGDSVNYTVINGIGTWSVNWASNRNLIAYTPAIKQISIQGTYSVSGTTLSISSPFLWLNAGNPQAFSTGNTVQRLWESLTVTTWDTGAGNCTFILQSSGHTKYCYARATNFVYSSTNGTKTLTFESVKVEGVAFDIELEIKKTGSIYTYTFTSTAI